MKLTSHEEYGLRCLVRLGQQGPGGSLTIPDISEAEGISEAYAAKLLRLLRQGGLVKAARGKVGGYSLARPAEEITLSAVMDVLGEPLFDDAFCEAHSGQMASCVRTVDCSLRVLWRRMQDAIDQVLERTTLGDLFRDEKQMVAWMGAPERSMPEPGNGILSLSGSNPVPPPRAGVRALSAGDRPDREST